MNGWPGGDFNAGLMNTHRFNRNLFFGGFDPFGK